MADIVNTGLAADDGTGDTLRTAMQLINQRFQQLQGTLSQITWAPGLAIEATPARQWTVVDGQAYVATSNHIAGATFAADLAAGRWLAVDVVQLMNSLASAAGASLVGYMPAGAGAVPTDMQTKQRRSSFDVLDVSGVDASGVTDSTAGLAIALARGGDIEIPDGDYLIAGSGADAGGVAVVLTRSTRVRCSPRARFFTDSLDNDLFRFTVPPTGTGLPADGIDFEWQGGFFDQRNQKNSLVVPFMTEYPRANPGASNTAESLYIDGSYNPGTGIVPGIRTARVIGASFVSGDHWQTAGGDGHIFMAGCKKHEALYCYHRGSRDSGFYSSSDATGAVLSKVTAIGNLYENCFVGAKQQRSAGDVSFIGNTFVNVPRAMAVEWDIGVGSKSGTISGNTGRGCGIPVRLSYARNYGVTDNHFTDAGATLADGVTIEAAAGMNGFVLRGASDCTVRGNSVIGVKAAANTAYPLQSQLLLIESFVAGGSTIESANNRLQENVSDGLLRLGNCAGDRNTFLDNEARNASVSNMSTLGTNAVEVRVNPTTGLRNFNTPTGFGDGTAALPSIARAAQTSTGVFFATNKVALSGGGSERVSATNVGVSFNGATPAARPVFGAPTGTATRTAFDTATVTTAQLAERVKAVIDDLRTYGLAG